MAITRSMSRKAAEARMQKARRSTPRYKPSDTTKRHRLPDDDEKKVKVVSYMRRR